MAVIVTPNASALKIKFDCGFDENNKILMKIRTYNGVKPSASNEDVLAVANALVALQDNTLESITKVDNTSLSE